MFASKHRGVHAAPTGPTFAHNRPPRAELSRCGEWDCQIDDHSEMAGADIGPKAIVDYSNARAYQNVVDHQTHERDLRKPGRAKAALWPRVNETAV
jgi:hypothetical protein